MKIIQVMPTVSLGDAVSNDARAIARVISDMGYKTRIYAENIDRRIKDSCIRKISKLPRLNCDDIVIFNHSTGTQLCYTLPQLGGRKMMIYHNITPPEFFDGFSPISAALTRQGYEGTKFLSDKIDYVMAVSKYNAEDLRRMGYTCPMSVRPILIPFEDYKKHPDAEIVKEYGEDGYTNIVFVGRIAPNKKQEDLIKIFAYYKKKINPKSRLIIVGNDVGMEKYSGALKAYTEALELDDVIFTGHISFKALLAYYEVADVFLCMSEHEGFGVPLVEAMFFDVPIIAYNSSAIADTLGGSGVLVDDKDPVLVSKLIERIVTDKPLRNSILSTQRKRLDELKYDTVKDRFTKQLKSFIECRISEENI